MPICARASQWRIVVISGNDACWLIYPQGGQCNTSRAYLQNAKSHKEAYSGVLLHRCKAGQARGNMIYRHYGCETYSGRVTRQLFRRIVMSKCDKIWGQYYKSYLIKTMIKTYVPPTHHGSSTEHVNWHMWDFKWTIFTNEIYSNYTINIRK